MLKLNESGSGHAWAFCERVRHYEDRHAGVTTTTPAKAPRSINMQAVTGEKTEARLPQPRQCRQKSCVFSFGGVVCGAWHPLEADTVPYRCPLLNSDDVSPLRQGSCGTPSLTRYVPITVPLSGLLKKWLREQESNLRMRGPKPRALPTWRSHRESIGF